jgi:hypothetical protein
MFLLPRLLSRVFGLGLAFALAALSACAAGPGAAVEWRLLVKVATPSIAGTEVAERAARTGGVPARYVAAVSPQWHGLVLRCRSEAACAEAVQRLQADTSYFLAVERDERRRAHAPASNPS